MRVIYLIISLFLVPILVGAQDVDVSMYWNKTGEYINYAESDSGDLWNALGHHGPAIENKWLAFRIYFHPKSAFDVYSKFKPQLELKKTKWYADKHTDNPDAYGVDLFHVGKSIGIGSARLYEDGKVKMLTPVKRRWAKTVKEPGSASIIYVSEGIPYKGDSIDVMLKLTVFAGFRYARVELFVLSDSYVNFVTGINQHKECPITEKEGYMFSWGPQPSDVAKEKIPVGAGLIYDPNTFEKTIRHESEHLIVSKPTKYISWLITSANEREQEINTKEAFEKHILQLQSQMK